MPGRGHFNRFLSGVALAALAAAASCGTGPGKAGAKRQTSSQTSAGDVALDSVTEAVNAHWLTDANVIALMGLVNQRQMDVAHAELQAWASDTVKALAANMWQAYAAQQQSLDSLAGALKIAGVLPAIGVSLDTSLQQRTAPLTGLGAARLDSAFLRTALAQDDWAAGYFEELSTIAAAPALVSFAAIAANRATLQSNAIRGFIAQRAAPTAADSAQATDSTRRRRQRVNQ